MELLEYGFIFLMNESYLSSFNDWHSRLIIARCTALVAPFRARAVFFGIFPMFVNEVAVNFGLCVSDKVDEHRLSSFSIDRQCFKQTFVRGGVPAVLAKASFNGLSSP